MPSRNQKTRTRIRLPIESAESNSNNNDKFQQLLHGNTRHDKNQMWLWHKMRTHSNQPNELELHFNNESMRINQTLRRFYPP